MVRAKMALKSGRYLRLGRKKQDANARIAKLGGGLPGTRGELRGNNRAKNGKK